jgi:hypothetical protein
VANTLHQNHTLRVKINLLGVKIIVVSVVITFVRFKITMRVEITLCVSKSHSCVSYTHAYVSNLLSCVQKTHSACGSGFLTLCVEAYLVRVEITLCMYKLHSSMSLSHKLVSKCQNYTCVCGNHTVRV